MLRRGTVFRPSFAMRISNLSCRLWFWSRRRGCEAYKAGHESRAFLIWLPAHGAVIVLDWVAGILDPAFK